MASLKGMNFHIVCMSDRLAFLVSSTNHYTNFKIPMCFIKDALYCIWPVTGNISNACLSPISLCLSPTLLSLSVITHLHPVAFTLFNRKVQRGNKSLYGVIDLQQICHRDWNYHQCDIMVPCDHHDHSSCYC